MKNDTPNKFEIDEHDFVEDFDHENGQYLNTCHKCQHIFMGHKRRVTCKSCSNVVSVGDLSTDYERTISIPKADVMGEPELYTCDVCGYCVHLYPLRPLSQLTPEWFALKGICYDCFFSNAVKSMSKEVCDQ